MYNFSYSYQVLQKKKKSYKKNGLLPFKNGAWIPQEIILQRHVATLSCVGNKANKTLEITGKE